MKTNNPLDQLHLSPEEEKQSEELLEVWTRNYKVVSERLLSPEEKEVMKQGNNDNDGFLCFVIGRIAPFIWTEFIMVNPKEKDKEAERIFDECCELFFRNETIHFVNLHYATALKLFKIGAYIGCIEGGMIEFRPQRKDPDEFTPP